MPDINGIDFVKTLVTPPIIVFTTAYADYAVEGFKVNATGKATPKEIIDLKNQIIASVKEKFGIGLHPEAEIL